MFGFPLKLGQRVTSRTRAIDSPLSIALRDDLPLIDTNTFFFFYSI